MLVEVTADNNGNQCLRVLPFPAGTPEVPTTTAEVISSCQYSVYHDFMPDYGNKKLAVIEIKQHFEVPFEQRQALVRPQAQP